MLRKGRRLVKTPVKAEILLKADVSDAGEGAMVERLRLKALTRENREPR